MITKPKKPRVAIVDYALGNLFSIQAACAQVGMEAIITSDHGDIDDADAVFLPGVGAFGNAMHNLHQLNLVGPLKAIADEGKLLVGICLGMQLFMSESYEFGHHKGLDLVSGETVPFENPCGPKGKLKVPQVGWNTIYPPGDSSEFWQGSPLETLAPGSFMYFVHSFYVRPSDSNVWLSKSKYGDVTYCSGLQRDNLIGFQYHPERSGPAGAKIYRKLAEIIIKRKTGGDE
jgi:glutamine amidotransferase